MRSLFVHETRPVRLSVSLTPPLNYHLGINLHLVALLGQVFDADKVAEVGLADDLLVEYGGGALGEDVALELLGALVGLDVVALEGGLVGGDDGDVDVAAGAEVVPDAGLDGVGAQLDGFVAGQRGLPLGLEDGHGGQRARAHGHVGQLVGGAVGVDGEQVGAGGVDAGDDQVGADVALVAEQVLLEHGHAGDDAGLAAGGQGVQLELGADEGGCELGVGGGAGAGAPNVGRDVVQLLAVLVGDDGAGCGSCVGGDLERGVGVRLVGWLVLPGREDLCCLLQACRATHHYTAVVYAPDNRRSCAGGLGQRHAAGV